MARSETPLTPKVSRDDHAKTFSVSRGKIISADSTMREERLGHLMLSKGLISAEAMVLTIIDSAEQGQTRGYAHRRGHVTPHRLLEILQLQLTTRMSETMSWRHGWYTLYEGVPSSGGPPQRDRRPRAAREHRQRDMDTEEPRGAFEAHLEHRVIPRSSPAQGHDPPLHAARVQAQAVLTRPRASPLCSRHSPPKSAWPPCDRDVEAAGWAHRLERGPDDARNT